jgi:hypothetical protein
MLEPIVDEFGKEQNLEEFEEDHGQATQGKPSKLVAYFDPNFPYKNFPIMLYTKCIVFKLLLTFIAIC